MPTASDELRGKMEKYFGNRISEQGPIKYLQSQGFQLNANWTWTPPKGKNLMNMTDKEYDCFKFLIDEWDFGGLEKGDGARTKFDKEQSK